MANERFQPGEAHELANVYVNKIEDAYLDYQYARSKGNPTMPYVIEAGNLFYDEMKRKYDPDKMYDHERERDYDEKYRKYMNGDDSLGPDNNSPSGK